MSAHVADISISNFMGIVSIEGFDLGADGVTVDGVPSSQWSTAQAIEIGTEVFARAPRGLPLLWVKDGSLLDADHRTKLEAIAREHDMQVVIEVVGDGSDGAIVLEAGRVKGADS